MKRIMSWVVIFAVLSLWIPCASVEISQELDPMVSPDAQATVTSETPAANVTADQASNVVSTADAAKEEKKVEETKKEKSKKASKKKSSEKKKKKSSTKTSKKHKKSSN
ncbi:MAG: hypothetical protein PHV97_05895 [Candidatus Omnitrophica bacterium]|nr:hypothetical protein [Candidatus Omnitrophota bacterium]